MDIGDVKGGNIPFSIAAKFKKMNKLIGHVARRLGLEGGKALKKARRTTYCGENSIKEVLSAMLRIVTKEEDIVQFMGRSTRRFASYEGKEYCIPETVRTGDVAEAFWSFVCDSFAGYVVEVCALRCLLDIREMMTRSTSQNNIMIATSILLHLSDYRASVIHEPMAHDCRDSCAQKIINHAAKKAAGSSKLFNEMMKNNAMWRSYRETGNYGVLDRLLVIVAKPKYNNSCEEAGKIVEVLMQCGVQPGGRYSIGKYKNKTVLHSVAEFPEEGVGIEIARALLSGNNEESINKFVNTTDDRGMTALHIASQKGRARMCELFVDHGAVVTAHDKDGMTALHYALEGGMIDLGAEIAQALIRRCDEQSVSDFVNAADSRGRTALHSASLKGNERLCELLLDYGAIVTSRETKGKTALHYALEAGNDKVVGVGAEIAQALLRGCDEQCIYDFVNATDEKGKSALHIASQKGIKSICALLVDRGALVNARDNEGMTALHYAFEGEIDKAVDRGAEIAKTLLDRCDQGQSELVNAADERGRTALHVASEKGNVRACGLLLDHGAVVTAQDNKRMTSLHYAFKGKNDEVVETKIAEALIRRCEDQSKYDFVNATDTGRKTALHRASKKGNARTCKVLVDLGASVTARDINGRTALHYAFKGGIGKLVVARTEITQALICKCDKESISEFVNAPDERGRTALHAASEKGDVGACELLLKHGAILTLKDKEGTTALHYAFERGIDKNIDVVTEIAEAFLRKCNQPSINEFVCAVDEKGELLSMVLQ